MTIKETMLYIKKLGASVKRTEYKEYKVNVPHGTEDTAYCTEDSEDAIGTAKAMMDNWRSHQ